MTTQDLENGIRLDLANGQPERHGDPPIPSRGNAAPAHRSTSRESPVPSPRGGSQGSDTPTTRSVGSKVSSKAEEIIEGVTEKKRVFQSTMLQFSLDGVKKEFDDLEIRVGKVLSEKIPWIDEVARKKCFIDPSNLYWQTFVGLTIVLDLVVLIIDLSVDLSGHLWEVTGIAIFVLFILTVDFAARVVDKADKCIFIAFDAFVLLLTLADIILSTSFPFAAVRFMRPARLLRPLRALKKFAQRFFDSAADKALDKIFEVLAGDVLYFDPDHITLTPSAGILCVDKSHILPDLFKGMPIPVTVKGGFIERMYLDLDWRKSANHGRRVVIILTNVLIVLGPSDIGLHLDTWKEGQFVPNKNKLVEAIVARTERILAKKKKQDTPGVVEVGHAKKSKKKKELKPRATTILGKLRQALQEGPLGKIVDLSNVSVDIQNCEIRFEDFDILPQQTCAGIRIGNSQFRITSHQMGLHGVKEGFEQDFRAHDHWNFTMPSQEEMEARNSYLTLNRSKSQSLGDTLSQSLGLSSASLASRIYQGVKHKVEKKENPPVKIAFSCNPILAWWDINVAWDDSYSQYFDEPRIRKRGAEPWVPKVSVAARKFRREHLREQLKAAAMSILHANKGGAKHALHHFEERILPHTCILHPLSVSVHAMTVEKKPEEPLHSGPEQVIDIMMPWLQIMLDVNQLRSIRLFERYLKEFAAISEKFTRKPCKRPCDKYLVRVSPQRCKVEGVHQMLRESQARYWWQWAVEEIAHEVAPKGSLQACLDMFRRSKKRMLYTEMLYDRSYHHHDHTQIVMAPEEDTAGKTKTDLKYKKNGSTLSSAGTYGAEWNEEFNYVQAALSLGDILRVRRHVRERLMQVDEDEKKAKARKGHAEVSPMHTPIHSPRDDEPHDVVVKVKIPQRQEPLKARFHIDHVRIGLLAGRGGEELHDAGPGHVRQCRVQTKKTFQHEDGPVSPRSRLYETQKPLGVPYDYKTDPASVVRMPLLYINIHNVSADWLICAPADEWEHLAGSNEAPEHLHHKRHSAAYAHEGISLGMATETETPQDEDGNMVPHWFGFSARIDKVVIINVQAPTQVPSLRLLLARYRSPKEKRKSKSKPKPETAMIQVRMVRWQKETEADHGGVPSSGVLSAYICDLKIAEYNPLVKLLADAAKPAAPHFKVDDLELWRVRLALEERRKGQIADTGNIRKFEKMSGMKLESGCKVSTSSQQDLIVHPKVGLSAWRIYVTMGELRVKIVMPYTDRWLLLTEFRSPRSTRMFKRMAWPAMLVAREMFEEDKGPSGLGDMAPWVPRSGRAGKTFRDLFSSSSGLSVSQPGFSLYNLISKMGCSQEDALPEAVEYVDPIDSSDDPQLFVQKGVVKVSNKAKSKAVKARDCSASVKSLCLADATDENPQTTGDQTEVYEEQSYVTDSAAIRDPDVTTFKTVGDAVCTTLNIRVLVLKDLETALYSEVPKYDMA